MPRSRKRPPTKPTAPAPKTAPAAVPTDGTGVDDMSLPSSTKDDALSATAADVDAHENDEKVEASGAATPAAFDTAKTVNEAQLAEFVAAATAPEPKPSNASKLMRQLRGNKTNAALPGDSTTTTPPPSFSEQAVPLPTTEDRLLSDRGDQVDCAGGEQHVHDKTEVDTPPVTVDRRGRKSDPPMVVVPDFHDDLNSGLVASPVFGQAVSSGESPLLPRATPSRNHLVESLKVRHGTVPERATVDTHTVQDKEGQSSNETPALHDAHPFRDTHPAALSPTAMTEAQSEGMTVTVSDALSGDSQSTAAAAFASSVPIEALGDDDDDDNAHADVTAHPDASTGDASTRELHERNKVDANDGGTSAPVDAVSPVSLGSSYSRVDERQLVLFQGDQWVVPGSPGHTPHDTPTVSDHRHHSRHHHPRHALPHQPLPAAHGGATSGHHHGALSRQRVGTPAAQIVGQFPRPRSHHGHQQIKGRRGSDVSAGKKRGHARTRSDEAQLSDERDSDSDGDALGIPYHHPPSDRRAITPPPDATASASMSANEGALVSVSASASARRLSAEERRAVGLGGSLGAYGGSSLDERQIVVRPPSSSSLTVLTGDSATGGRESAVAAMSSPLTSSGSLDVAPMGYQPPPQRCPLCRRPFLFSSDEMADAARGLQGALPFRPTSTRSQQGGDNAARHATTAAVANATAQHEYFTALFAATAAALRATEAANQMSAGEEIDVEDDASVPKDNDDDHEDEETSEAIQSRESTACAEKEAQTTSAAAAAEPDDGGVSISYYETHFEEIAKLGQGSFGGVFVCRHMVGGQAVGMYAVKKIPVGDDQTYLVQAVREVQILVRLHRHPNVVNYAHSWTDVARTCDFGPPVRCLFILMEWANAGSLTSFVEQQRAFNLSDDLVWFFALSTLRGLDSLHRANVLHRDVKPENILLADEDGDSDDDNAEDGTGKRSRVRPPRVLLSDFGTAGLRDNFGSLADRTGGTGTIEFMAPELLWQTDDGSYVGRHSREADLYSLGVVVHYLAFNGSLPKPASRRRPHPGQRRTPAADLVRVEECPDRSPAIIALIESLLQPDARYRAPAKIILGNRVVKAIWARLQGTDWYADECAEFARQQLERSGRPGRHGIPRRMRPQDDDSGHAARHHHQPRRAEIEAPESQRRVRVIQDRPSAEHQHQQQQQHHHDPSALAVPALPAITSSSSSSGVSPAPPAIEAPRVRLPIEGPRAPKTDERSSGGSTVELGTSTSRPDGSSQTKKKSGAIMSASSAVVVSIDAETGAYVYTSPRTAPLSAAAGQALPSVPSLSLGAQSPPDESRGQVLVKMVGQSRRQSWHATSSSPTTGASVSTAPLKTVAPAAASMSSQAASTDGIVPESETPPSREFTQLKKQSQTRLAAASSTQVTNADAGNETTTPPQQSPEARARKSDNESTPSTPEGPNEQEPAGMYEPGVGGATPQSDDECSSEEIPSPMAPHHRFSGSGYGSGSGSLLVHSGRHDPPPGDSPSKRLGTATISPPLGAVATGPSDTMTAGLSSGGSTSGREFSGGRRRFGSTGSTGSNRSRDSPGMPAVKLIMPVVKEKFDRARASTPVPEGFDLARFQAASKSPATVIPTHATPPKAPCPAATRDSPAQLPVSDSDGIQDPLRRQTPVDTNVRQGQPLIFPSALPGDDGDSSGGRGLRPGAPAPCGRMGTGTPMPFDIYKEEDAETRRQRSMDTSPSYSPAPEGYDMPAFASARHGAGPHSAGSQGAPSAAATTSCARTSTGAHHTKHRGFVRPRRTESPAAPGSGRMVDRRMSASPAPAPCDDDDDDGLHGGPGASMNPFSAGNRTRHTKGGDGTGQAKQQSEERVVSRDAALLHLEKTLEGSSTAPSWSAAPEVGSPPAARGPEALLGEVVSPTHAIHDVGPPQSLEGTLHPEAFEKALDQRKIKATMFVHQDGAAPMPGAVLAPAGAPTAGEKRHDVPQHERQGSAATSDATPISLSTLSSVGACRADVIDELHRMADQHYDADTVFDPHAGQGAHHIGRYRHRLHRRRGTSSRSRSRSGTPSSTPSPLPEAATVHDNTTVAPSKATQCDCVAPTPDVPSTAQPTECESTSAKARQRVVSATVGGGSGGTAASLMRVLSVPVPLWVVVGGAAIAVAVLRTAGRR